MVSSLASRMPARRRTIAAVMLSLILAAMPVTGSVAQETAPGLLPGGASSLTETHADWTVSCRLARQEEQPVQLCSLAQQQTDNQRRRTLAIELQPKGDGIGGVMVLPFGLTVTQKVTLTIDESEQGFELPFSTCLPAGCLVPITFDAATTNALRQGATLTVTAAAANGGEVRLAISLAGLASALDRTRELLK